ncbi:hypothetical protein [Lentzea sp. NPDC092896]|uniref:hypothetical protein n=1 Tax=Lentzea sp. NPDC092896 TaxID=3364127 RepID=UPI003820C632
MPESPSALLERAAARLDELANAAPQGPWKVAHDGDVHGYGPVPIIYSEHGDVEVQHAPGVHDWLRVMNPVIAEPLAKWLRNSARYLHFERGAVSSPENGRAFFEGKYGGALEFARRILGEHIEEGA